MINTELEWIFIHHFSYSSSKRDMKMGHQKKYILSFISSFGGSFSYHIFPPIFVLVALALLLLARHLSFDFWAWAIAGHTFTWTDPNGTHGGKQVFIFATKLCFSPNLTQSFENLNRKVIPMVLESMKAYGNEHHNTKRIVSLVQNRSIRVEH